MQPTRVLLASLSLISSLSAQVVSDGFDIPSIPGLPPVLGWTVQSGNWSVANGRLKTDGSSVWAFITKDGSSATNCVLDAELFYLPGGLQFAGLTARFGTPTSTLMCKIQKNTAASGGFDRAFVYQWSSGGSTWANTNSIVQSAFGRMIVIGSQSWMQLDLDKDGVYEQSIGPHNV